MSRTIIDASVAISSGLIHWRATLKLMFQGAFQSLQGFFDGRFYAAGPAIQPQL